MQELANYGPLGIICGILLGGFGVLAVWIRSFINATESRHVVERESWNKTIADAISTFANAAAVRGRLIEQGQQTVLALTRLNELMAQHAAVQSEHTTESREALRSVQLSLVEATTALRRQNGIVR